MNRIVTRSMSLDLVKKQIDHINQRIKTLEGKGNPSDQDGPSQDPNQEQACAVCLRKMASSRSYKKSRRRKTKSRRRRRRSM